MAFHTPTDESALLARLLASDSARDSAWREFLHRYSNLFLKIIWKFEKDRDGAMEKYVYVCERFAANNFEILRRFKADYGERPPKFTTWLAAVARNMCIDVHRSVHGRRQLPRSVQRMSDVEQMIFRLYYWKGRTVDEIRELVKAKLRSPSDFEAESLIAGVLSSHEGVKPSTASPRFVPFDEEFMEPTEPDYDTADLHRWLENWLQELPSQERMILRLRFWEEMSGAEIAAAMSISPEQRVYPLIKAALQHLREKAEREKK
jgi:RNA polymerase sigma factor (sigma-70 family)